MSDLADSLFHPSYLDNPSSSSSSSSASASSSSSSSSSHLYSICVNWEESLFKMVGKDNKSNNLSSDWEEGLSLSIARKGSISPSGKRSGIRVVLGIRKPSSSPLMSENAVKSSEDSKSLEDDLRITEVHQEETKGDDLRVTEVHQEETKEDDLRMSEVHQQETEEDCGNQTQCVLPLLEMDPNLVDCRVCSKYVDNDKVLCSVSSCNQAYHLKCAEDKLGFCPSRKFKCPLHVCFLCKQKGAIWQCIRCTMAVHPKCAPWPDRVRHTTRPGKVVCWRHYSDRQLGDEPPVPINIIKPPVLIGNSKDIFCHLPEPCTHEEFSARSLLKEMPDKSKEPYPYVPIRRNVYLVKKKPSDLAGCGGTSCDASGCMEGCVCRGLSISCSKVCNCSETCANRQFRKDKKIKLYKSDFCGWGVVAAEAIKEGDFIIEYVGEVIDEAECEARLWHFKKKEVQEFYLCEVQKDFTIDATYKGNLSRFINHSCDPNCRMEKWEVDGETRLGIFAVRSIEVGEPLTYDYKFVCFGKDVECMCGSVNCQGSLGNKKKIAKEKLNWHSTRRRSTYNEMKAQIDRDVTEHS